MNLNDNNIILHGSKVSLIIDQQFGVPKILYFGKKLQHSSVQMLQTLATRQEAKCAVVEESPLALTPFSGLGFTGYPGLEIHGDADQWASVCKVTRVIQASAQAVTIISQDVHRHIELHHLFELDYDSNVLKASTKLKNLGDQAIQVQHCAAPTMPLPSHIHQITSFEGRWSNEFQRHQLDLFMGSFVRENRRGKTSHDTYPGLLLSEASTTEQQGEVYGFHLGWSGNHKFRAELMADGRAYVQMAELLFAGELVLEKGQSYHSPEMFVSYSANGTNLMSQQFHQYVRRKLLSEKVRTSPRPVHFNTWEGLYFDHNEQTLIELAKLAAKAGAERFVLDDGWFKGRRNDKAGLGDWVVDESIYPNGLHSLIEQVNALGLEFGIWFEPEMVNPDSDLYRAHPDWVLHNEHNEHLQFRHQLVLDLTRTEVVDYLYQQISDILSTYPQIRYIKWDMNRDVNHPGDAHGKPAMHGQIQALYQLIAKIKQAFPYLEIESCCSGGGRADYGILHFTDRVWTSDSNDALDRLSIQRGFSYFLPPELMGAHAGPRDCHITGRHIDIEMRAAVAMFGHMGMEMDPRELNEHEMQVMQQATQFYKQHRQLIHHGNYYRLDDNGLSVDFGFVSEDQQQAIFAYNSVKETPRVQPAKLRFVGLQADTLYQLNRVWPNKLFEYSPNVLAEIEGQCFSGEALMQFGLQLPIVFPQTSLVFTLTAQ